MDELVSVVMPNYNSEKYIAETIHSVISQTYTNWELLIVDDCSTDNSTEIIREIQKKDNRIKLFVNESNRGAAYSRNVALREAKGKWVAFLDSDDMWIAEKLEKQISFMKENGYLFSYTDYIRIDEDSLDMNIRITGPKKIGKRKMYRYCYIGCLTVMYDAEKIGLLQVEEKVGNGRNDYALWLKACKKADCYLLKEVLAKYRIRKNSLSHRSMKKLIRYQYELFRYGEQFGKLKAVFYTMRNLFYGFLKKLGYEKKEKTECNI